MIHEEFSCQFLLGSEDTQQYNDLPDRFDYVLFPQLYEETFLLPIFITIEICFDGIP